MGISAQDVWLMSDTVEQNISLGSVKATLRQCYGLETYLEYLNLLIGIQMDINEAKGKR